jgi:hypothetical protein
MITLASNFEHGKTHDHDWPQNPGHMGVKRLAYIRIGIGVTDAGTK